MYRRRGGEIEVLLVHPGGPFWAKKDEGVWSIPKGEAYPGDDELLTARREFEEETGVKPDGEFIPIGTIKQKSGKVVHAWAFEGDCNPSTNNSNTFKIEWPPHSGKKQEFPEVDRAAFFGIDEAKKKINPAQIALLEELRRTLADHQLH
jgi:predicted NUDIX family NTP pyrophosphohydrolase